MKLSPLVHPSPVGPVLSGQVGDRRAEGSGSVTPGSIVLANKDGSRRSSHLLTAYRVWCSCYRFLRVGICLKWPALRPTSVLDTSGVQLEPAS